MHRHVLLIVFRQKREEQQFPEDGQPHNESMEDKDEERKISMPQVYAT